MTPFRGAASEGAMGFGVVLLLLAATLGEGGAAPTAMVLWHGLLLLLVLLALWNPRAHQGPSRPVVVALLLFGAVALVGACLAPYGFAAWLLLVELGAFLVLLVLASRDGAALLRRLAPPLLVVALLQAGWVMLDIARGAVRPAGSFLNTNHLAAWLVASTLLALGPALLASGAAIPRRAPPPRTVAAAAAALWLLAAVWLTGSRGALLGLAAGALSLFIMAWPRMTRRRRLVVVTASVVGIAVLGATLWVRRQGEADPFRYQRARIWQASLQLVGEHPWTGSGPRQFAQAARNLQFPDGDGLLRYDRGFSVTHSDALRVPCELGWPGALAGVLVLLALIRALRRRTQRDDWGDRERAALAALVALATQALVENLSQRPAVYLLQAALLGALLARPTASPRWDAPWLRAAATVLLLTMFAVGDVAPYLAWRAYSTGFAEDGTPDGEALERALQLNPIQPEYWRHLALARVDEGFELQDYLEGREAAERAARLNPTDSDTFWTLAQIEARGCRALFRDTASRARARERFDDAAQRSRFNAIIPLAEARFLLDTGDAAGARRAAERALTLEPRAIVARLLLARALMAQSATTPEVLERAQRLVVDAREAAAALTPDQLEDAYARSMLVPGAALIEAVERDLAASRHR